MLQGRCLPPALHRLTPGPPACAPQDLRAAAEAAFGGGDAPGPAPALPQGSGPLADFLLARWKESQGRERLRQRQQQWAAS